MSDTSSAAPSPTPAPAPVRKAVTSFAELGTTGLTQFNGRVADDFLLELRGERGRKVLREMADNDPVIGAELFALDMLMRQVEWTVEPANPNTPTARQEELAEFVWTNLHDMSMTWHDTISSILSMAVYGWSFHEIVYKRRLGYNDDPSATSAHSDGKIGWRKLPIRLQNTLYRWEFDANGGVQGMWQSALPDFKPRLIPISAALLFRTSTATGSPEGRSMLRNAYRPWYFKQRIEEIEGTGVERDLAGLPVAWVPPSMLSSDASAVEKDALTQIQETVKMIRRDANEGIIFPLS